MLIRKFLSTSRGDGLIFRDTIIETHLVLKR